MSIIKPILRFIAIVAGMTFVALLAVLGYITYLYADDVRALQSVKKVSHELYEMTYRGDYGLEAFIEQGGVRDDKDLQPFLRKWLSHGLYDVETPAPQVPDIGCSTLCAPMADAQAYLFGRNFDWAKKGTTIIIRTFPKNGYASISTSNLDFLGMPLNLDSKKLINRLPALAAIYVPLDGINEKGLMIADLFAGDHEKTMQERGNLSVTTTTAIRLLLDRAASTNEAIDMLRAWDMHSSIDWAHHIAIADKSGHSVVVEWIENEMIVVETPAVTNHYLTPLRPHVGIGATEQRRDILCARLAAQPKMQISDMKQLLQDVAFEQYTGWSVIFNTGDNSATYYYRTDFTQPYVYTLHNR